MGSGAIFRRGPGLRLRMTLLATLLAALVSALLLWLAWVLVGDVAAAVPQLPDGTPVRVQGVEVPAEHLAAALRADARGRVLGVGGFAVVAVVGAAGLLSWTVTGRVLRPLQDVTDSARRLSAESLDERIALGGPRDEVAELADTFDRMLDRLQGAFDAQRRFVANASHELRTPLSVIRTELDVTLADPDADAQELRRMAGVVRAAAEKAEHLVEALLVLARTEGTALSVREPVNLAEVLTSALEPIEMQAHGRGLRISRSGDAAFAMGDPTLLERIAGNLLENAVQHNVDGGWIEVSTTRAAQWSSLRVAASGAPLDWQRAEELFEPFHRDGIQRTARAGAGLGLSIVRAAALAHGGRTWAEPVPGGGLAVSVDLPAAA